MYVSGYKETLAVTIICVLIRVSTYLTSGIFQIFDCSHVISTNVPGVQ